MYPSVRKCPEEMNHFKPDGPSGIQDCFNTSGVAGTQQTSGVKNITTHSLPEELLASIPVHNGEDTSSEGSEGAHVQYFVIEQLPRFNSQSNHVTTSRLVQDDNNVQQSFLKTTCNSNVVIKMLNKGNVTGTGESPKKVVIEYGGRSEDGGSDLMVDHAVPVEDNGLMVNHSVPVENQPNLVTEDIVSSQPRWKGPHVQTVAPTDDKLICGQCSYMCCDVKDFLFHKSTHVGHKKGQGCELCGLGFSRQRTLTDHYRQKHKVMLSVRHSYLNKVPVKLHKDVIENNLKNSSVKDLAEIMDTNSLNESLVTDLADNSGGTVTVFSRVNAENVFMKNKIAHESRTNITLQEELSPSDSQKELVSEENEGADNTSIPFSPTADDVDDIVSKHSETSFTTLVKSTISSDIVNGTCADSGKPFTTSVEQIVTDVTKTNLSYKSEAEKNNNSKCISISNISQRLLEPSISSINQRSLEPNDSDFHFISNIGIVKGQSLSYGKHEFKCLHCPFKTQWRNTLCHHMKEKHSNLIGNDVHLKVNHLANKDGQKVLRMSEYINMQKKKVKGKVRSIETQDLPGDFPCTLCGKVYHRLRYLRCHMKRHTSATNLLCSTCGKAFKTKAYLTQHIKVHRTKEMYQCSQCEFASSVNTLIHAHIQIHNDGCLICDICGTAFTDKSTLQRHKRVHDKSRPFACKFAGCTLRFKKEVTCNGHYKQHFTKGKFECSVCGYVFRQKHHLLRHEKTIHKLSPVKDTTKPNIANVQSKSDIQENLDVPLDINVTTENHHMETNEVNLIVNEEGGMNVATENADDQFDLETALQSGQLVIATDEDGNPVNYEMPDIGMNVAYQTLLHGGEGQELDTHTILIPQADANHIVFEEVTETVGTYVES